MATLTPKEMEKIRNMSTEERIALGNQSKEQGGSTRAALIAQAVDKVKNNSINNATVTQPTASGYIESDAVTQAKNNLASLSKPGAYASPWQENLNSVIDKILNREKFSYDLNGDALYQQYKDQYINQGQQAMMDTIGQASALTGGYGNSYAQSVGQQTYQGHLQELNNKIPELYQLALDQYNREGEEMYNQYGLLADRENTEYGRYRDELSDFYTDRDYLTNQYNTERDFDYGTYRDTVADSQWQTEFDESVRQYDEQFGYQKDRDAVADEQWQKSYEEDIRQFDTETALTREQMQIQKEQWQKEFTESIRQYNNDYTLKVRQIEEDVRHNKITEAQAQQQIDLAKQELAQEKANAEKELAYKYAALNASKSSGSSSSSSTTNNNTTTKKSETTPETTKKVNKTYSEAVAYMKQNGVPNSNAAGILTASEFSRWKEKGNFADYSEYLDYVTEYNIQKYGK